LMTRISNPPPGQSRVSYRRNLPPRSNHQNTEQASPSVSAVVLNCFRNRRGWRGTGPVAGSSFSEARHRSSSGMPPHPSAI
jgi:hypothetical protein